MVYSLDRRTVMAAGAASLLTPIPAWSQDSASRLYRLTRDGSDIGTHQLTVSRIGDTVTAKTDISIAVKFLGITAYRYELTYSEVYRGGLLQQLNGTANDDGDAGYVNVIRQGDALEVDGSDFSGAITGAAMPGLARLKWLLYRNIRLDLAFGARRMATNIPSILHTTRRGNGLAVRSMPKAKRLNMHSKALADRSQALLYEPMGQNIHPKT